MGDNTLNKKYFVYFYLFIKILKITSLSWFHNGGKHECMVKYNWILKDSTYRVGNRKKVLPTVLESPLEEVYTIVNIYTKITTKLEFCIVVLSY